MGYAITFHFDGDEIPQEVHTQKFQGIWWLRNDTTTDYIILSNSSSKPMQISAAISDLNNRQQTTTLALGPRQSGRIDVRELVSKGGLQSTWGGFSLSVLSKTSGLTAAEIVFDEPKRFSALLKVFEQDGSQKSVPRTLRAPMLALSAPDPVLAFPEGTTLRPKVFLRNATGTALAFAATLNWRTAQTSGSVALPGAPLSPGETRLIDIAALQAANQVPASANWATVALKYEGIPGDLVAVASSFDSTGRYGLQTPFSESVGSHWKGSMWHVDAVHDSLITAGNGGDRPINARMTLFYEGGKSKYNIEKQLAPGEQIWADVGQIIRRQLPDKDGHVIPPTEMAGSYELLDLDHHSKGYVYEGKLVLDRTYGRAFYGCGTCCRTTNPQLHVTPFSDLVGINAWDNVTVTDCTGYVWDETGYNFGSDDASIATLGQNAYLSLVGAGSTYTSTTVDLVTRYCLDNPTQARQSVAACAVPTNFHQVGVADIGGGVLRFDYVWGSSTGKLPDLGTSGCTVSEIVTYPGSNPYYWPSPPWAYNTPNPTISPTPPKPGQDGSLEDFHYTGTLTTSHATASFTATQYYRYSCSCNNSSNVNLAGPISITRSVSQNADGTWKYTITKSGASASINPLP